MDKQDLRMRLNKFIEESGVSAKHISKRCSIPEYTLSKFRNNKIGLFKEATEALEDYLTENNA